jgi:hypothetical protein
VQPVIRHQESFPTDLQLQGKDGHSTFKGAKQLRDVVASHIEKVSKALTDYNNVDTLANRPPPGRTGRQFFATDTNTLYKDNGSAWIPIGGSGPFTVSVSTSNVTASPSTNLYILDTSSGNITVTLPAATGSNFAPIFKKPSPMNNLFIQPAGTNTLDGNAYPSGYLVTSIWRKIQLVDYATGKWAIL